MNSIASFFSRSRAAPSPPCPVIQPDQYEREHPDHFEQKELDESLNLMDFIESVESVEPLGQVARIDKPRCNALQASPFRKLPVELMQRIAFFLTPGSKAAFSLCCTSLLTELGSRSLNCLTANDRFEFLALLERELPEYIACQPCKKLHSIDKAHLYDWTNLRSRYCGPDKRPCYASDMIHGTSQYIHGDFSYPLFRMTMELYRQGKDYSELLKILSSTTMTWSDKDVSLQRCYLARIVNGSLVIREQTTVLFPPANRRMPRRGNIYRTLRHLHICPHRETVYHYDFDSNWDALPCPGWKQLQNNCRSLMMNSCKFCTTEFRTDFKELGDQGCALFLTKWMDLGQGRSPSDPKWEGHFPQSRYSGYTEFVPVEMEYGIGTIAASFEGGGISRFEFDTEFHFGAVATAEERETLFKQRPFNDNDKIKRLGDQIIELSVRSERLILDVSGSVAGVSCFIEE